MRTRAKLFLIGLIVMLSAGAYWHRPVHAVAENLNDYYYDISPTGYVCGANNVIKLQLESYPGLPGYMRAHVKRCSNVPFENNGTMQILIHYDNATYPLGPATSYSAGAQEVIIAIDPARQGYVGRNAIQASATNQNGTYLSGMVDAEAFYARTVTAKRDGYTWNEVGIWRSSCGGAADGYGYFRMYFPYEIPNTFYVEAKPGYTITANHAFTFDTGCNMYRFDPVLPGTDIEVDFISPSSFLSLYMLAFDNDPNSPHDLTPYYTDTVEAIRQATLGAPGKTAVVLSDLHSVGDTRILVIKNGQITFIQGLPNPDQNNTLDPSMTEYNMTDGRQLGAFLLWARATYPAADTTLSYVGHGTGLAPDTNITAVYPEYGLAPSFVPPLPSNRDVFPDFTDHHTGNESEKVAILSPYDLALALEIGTNDGANPISLLNILHCFAATSEEFYELANVDGIAPYAEVMVGSPSYAYFAPQMLGDSLTAWDAGQTPAELADTVLQTTAAVLHEADLSDGDADVEHPAILTAVQSDQLPALKLALDQLSTYLVAYLQANPADGRARIITALENSGKYDTTYCKPQDWELNSDDGLSDLGQFADALVQAFQGIGGIDDLASQISQLVDVAVINTFASSGQPWFGVPANGGPIPTWTFNGQGLALYTDVLGHPIGNQRYLGLPAHWYTATVSTENPHPYAFVVPSAASEVSWANVLDILWEGQNLATMACLPSYQTPQEQVEIGVERVLYPRLGTVIQNTANRLTAVITTNRPIYHVRVRFTITQNGVEVYRSETAVGYRPAGSYAITAPTPFIPTQTGPFVLTVQVDPDNHVIESNKADNTVVYHDRVWPPATWPRPVITAQIANNLQWFANHTVTLLVSQDPSTLAAPVHRLFVDWYQYVSGATPNTQVPVRGGRLTLNNLDLSNPATITLNLPNSVRPGILILHVWGNSAGGTSLEPVEIWLNIIPANTTCAAGKATYFMFYAAQGDALAFNLAVSQGDANLFGWNPENHWGPDYLATAVGSDSLLIDPAPFAGQYLLEVFCETDTTYTLTTSRNGIPNGLLTKQGVTAPNNPNATVPTQRPLFLAPIPDPNFIIYLPVIQ